MNRGRRAPRPTLVLVALIAMASAITSLAGSAVSPEQADAALADQIDDPQPRPHGPITVIGDSVLQGSLISAPTIVEQLAANGWGPIKARAGVGYSTGNFSTSAEAKSTFWFDRWRGEGWDAPVVLVNLGANDSGICDRSVQCAREAILHLVDHIGPGHHVWWPKITRHPFFQHQADTWNGALDQIADERPDFLTWDWPAEMAANGFASPDNTHLSSSGYQARSVMMADMLTADLAMGSRTGDDAPLPASASAPSELVPLDPVRVLDTRDDPPGRVAGGETIVVDVSAHVPAGTTAVAAYVSATVVGRPGFLTAHACGSPRPEASAANHLLHETRGAVTVVPVSKQGTFCLFTLADAHLLVDLQAAFVPDHPDGLRFDPLPTPSRLVDTRETGRRQIVEVPVPAGADAVSVSVTAIDADDHGFVVAYPCSDDVPLVATVNHGPGEVVSGTAFVRVGPDGTICVWSLTPVDLTVDLTGTFAPDGDLAFRSTTPTRMLDTRFGIGGWSPVHGRFQTIDVRVAPPGARAVTGTITIVEPARPAFLQAWGCGLQPETANVTAVAGAVLANAVTTGVDETGRLCIMSRDLTGSIFDTTGWWEPA